MQFNSTPVNSLKLVNTFQVEEPSESDNQTVALNIDTVDLEEFIEELRI